MSDMKNGKKIKRGKYPVQYRLKVGFKLTSVDSAEGSIVGCDLEIPIRKGFGEKLDKIKKGDVVALLNQLAEAIEKEDYSILGLPVDMTGVASAVRSRGAGQKAN
jgi:hypothetical protein